MKKLHLIRQEHLEVLRKDISKNIEIYNGNKKPNFPNPKEVTFEIDVEANLESLVNLDPSKSHSAEVNNCLIVYESFKNIKPDLARDERLWTYITHYHAFDYTRKRWPKTNESADSITHIKSHFFSKTNRDIERNNSISRLWWTAHIASKANSGSLKDNLTSLIFRTDVRSSFIERPSTSRNVNLLTAMLEELRKAYSTYMITGDLGILERNKFRKIMGNLNEVGGYKLLDSLSTETLKKMIID
jgi:hypothetical protein